MAIVIQPAYNCSFEDRPISDYDLQRIFETCIWAPSPFNSQPWEFIILKDKKRIQHVLNMDISDIPPNLLVVLNNIKRCDPGPNAVKLAFLSIGGALANLMFTADYSNIGIYPVLERMGQDHSDILRYLDVPEHLEFCCMMAFGYVKGFDDKKEKTESGVNPFIMIRKRKSYRKKFAEGSISDTHRNALLKSALTSFIFKRNYRVELVFIEENARITEMAEVISKLAFKIHMDSGYMKKMKTWMRYSSEEKVFHADGILVILWNKILSKTLKGILFVIEGIKVLHPVKILSTKKLSKDFFGDLVASSPMICTILLKNEVQGEKPDMFDYINTGVSMQSMLLCATRYGIGAQFLSILMDVPEGRVYMKSILNIPSGSNVETIDSIRMGYIDPESRASFFDVSSDIRRPIERILNKEKYEM